MRKKVKYDITKYGKNKTFHFSGIGEIDEENLYTRLLLNPLLYF